MDTWDQAWKKRSDPLEEGKRENHINHFFPNCALIIMIITIKMKELHRNIKIGVSQGKTHDTQLNTVFSFCFTAFELRAFYMLDKHYQ